MNDYNEVMSLLDEMRIRYNDGFSSSDRLKLDNLHVLLFNTPIKNRNCSDCYRDAYVLIYNKLKKEGQMPKKSEYILKTGVVLKMFGSNKVFINAVDTEYAETYLKQFPQQIKKFAVYPENWEERVAAFEPKNTEGKTEADVLRDEIAAESAKVSEKQIELDKANEKIAEQEEEINALRASIETLNETIATMSAKEGAEKEEVDVTKYTDKIDSLKGDLAAAKSEIKSLKAELKKMQNAEAKTAEAKNAESEELSLKAE